MVRYNYDVQAVENIPPKKIFVMDQYFYLRGNGFTKGLVDRIDGFNSIVGTLDRKIGRALSKIFVEYGRFILYKFHLIKQKAISKTCHHVEERKTLSLPSTQRFCLLQGVAVTPAVIGHVSLRINQADQCNKIQAMINPINLALEAGNGN